MLTYSNIEIPRTVEEAISLDRCALLVYDMQQGIISQMAGAEAVVGKVTALLAVAREVGLRTYFMRHTSLPRNLMGRFQIRQAMAWQRLDNPAGIKPWFLPGQPGTQIISELTPLATEAVFDKLGMSAFAGTPLDFALRDCDIHTIILCGVATEIGIEPTVRHAADLGYLPLLVEDAIGAGHPEAGHRAIASMRFMGDAQFTTTDEVIAMLRAKAPTK